MHPGILASLIIPHSEFGRGGVEPGGEGDLQKRRIPINMYARTRNVCGKAGRAKY